MLLLEQTQFLTINSPAFPILISVLAIFVTVFFNNKRLSRDMKNDNKLEYEKRADALNKKADLSWVKDKNLEYDKKLEITDSSIEAMKLNNSNQHNLLFEKIDLVGKGVARIEGYLSAQKEKK